MIIKQNFLRLLTIACLAISLVACTSTVNNTPQATALSLPEDNFNFIMATDLGRNGAYDQKPIAQAMGELAEVVDIEFVAASGDVHHYMGVASVSDPLWMTNYELIYNHPELQIPWYPILGNHEYKGNTQAVIDYTNVSRRWTMPGRYYSQSFSLDNDASLLLVFVDTAPLIDKYREDSLEYPDAARQDMQQQLAWIDSTLQQSAATWKIVVGHHPIYAETSKSDTERLNLQERLDPILQKNKVDIYVCGHIHNFQHIQVPGSDIQYVVNTSASLSRKVEAIEGTVFCSSETGFSVVSANDKKLDMYLMNKDKGVVYTFGLDK